MLIDYWDWVQETLNACPRQKYTYAQNFTLFSDTFNSIIYSSISMLVMALVYFLLRPTNAKKFRAWWKGVRYILFMMLVGTVSSVVSLIAASAWLFSWYNVRTDQYCDYSAANKSGAGIAIVVGSLLISLFFML
jgi:hypothetical protein